MRNLILAASIPLARAHYRGPDAATKLTRQNPEWAPVIHGKQWNAIWRQACRAVHRETRLRARDWAQRGLTSVMTRDDLPPRTASAVLRAVAVLTTAALDWRGTTRQPGTWDTIQLSAQRIGVRCGRTSPNAGTRLMRAAQDARLVTCVRATQGGSSVWRLPPIPRKYKPVARELSPMIEALVEGSADSTAALFRSAQHPAWDGAEDAWLVLLRGSVGRTVDLSTERERAARAFLEEHDLGRFAVTATGLTEALDAVAESTGTAAARRALMGEAGSRRAGFEAQREQVRERRGEVYSAMKSCPRLTPAAPPAEQILWLSWASAARAGVPERLAGELDLALSKRLVRCGFTEEQAGKVLAKTAC